MNKNLLRTTRIVAVVLIFVVAGFWVGQRFWQGSTMKPASGRLEQPAVAATELPDFSLLDLEAQPRSIHEWKDKALLINFWATWCAPCRREMPLLQTLAEERRGTPFQIIGIAVDELPAVSTYVSETGVTYPILVGSDDAMEAAESFGPDFVGLPFSVFVARGGKVLGTHSGELDREALRAVLKVMDGVSSGSISVAGARAQLAGDALQ